MWFIRPTRLHENLGLCSVRLLLTKSQESKNRDKCLYKITFILKIKLVILENP